MCRQVRGSGFDAGLRPERAGPFSVFGWLLKSGTFDAFDHGGSQDGSLDARGAQKCCECRVVCTEMKEA